MANDSVSATEIARFNALADQWWDPNGPMRALHRMNSARIGWISDQFEVAYPSQTGLRVLDVGCGAGLASEALARKGFAVLGIDAAAETIEAATVHAAGAGLQIEYRVASPEQVLAEGMKFPVITALEVVEHVTDPQGFVQTLASLLDPGGVVVLSTLNRTARSFLGAKIAAEYLLHWLPPGTHDWRRFLKPAEMAVALRRAGLRVTATCGLSLHPTRGTWRVSRDSSINYMIAAQAK